MIEISEAYIQSLAHNAAAFNNGKKLAVGKKFVTTYQTEDETLIFGECKGSGKSGYNVSADFVKPDQPVYRCSCPSRQIPCKHAIGLLYQYHLDPISFVKAQVPEDVASKREKIEKKVQKKNDPNTKPKQVNVSAFVKKMEKQLEGIGLVDKWVGELIKTGLASVPVKEVKGYSTLIKQMGDYYLPHHQVALSQLVGLLLDAKKSEETAKNYYSEAVRQLGVLHELNKRSSQLLQEHIAERKVVNKESAQAFCEMGYVFKVEELKLLGFYEENQELIQLAFNSYGDEYRYEYIDCGYFFNLQSGKLQATYNYRPFKAVSHMKADDSLFGVMKVSELYKYPGEHERRVKWNGAVMRQVEEKDYLTLYKYAKKDYKALLKEVKNTIKETLADKYPLVLIHYKELMRVGTGYSVVDEQGERIFLEDRGGNSVEPTTAQLPLLLKEKDRIDGLLFGMFHQNLEKGTLYIQPMSIVHGQEIIRLLY